jgi:hypothetical protein
MVQKRPSGVNHLPACHAKCEILYHVTHHIVTSQARLGLELELHHVRMFVGIRKHVGVKFLLLAVQNGQMGYPNKTHAISSSHLMRSQDGAQRHFRLHNNAESNDCQTKSFMAKTGSESRSIGRRLWARSPLVRADTGVSHRGEKALGYRHQ